MPAKSRTDYHKDGSIRAKGKMLDGELHGYWEWFRKDGSLMRSGRFKAGKQTGEWITYDAKGEVVKITQFSSYPLRAGPPRRANAVSWLDAHQAQSYRTMLDRIADTWEAPAKAH